MPERITWTGAFMNSSSIRYKIIVHPVLNEKPYQGPQDVQALKKAIVASNNGIGGT